MLAGDTADWLEKFRSLEERMIEAIEDAWPKCIAPLQLIKGSMTHEDNITNHLVASLRRNKKVPGRIHPQYSLLVEQADKTVVLSSKIDFVLTIGDDEDVYLACECKRLNVPYENRVRSLVIEYVDDGLMRFITEQYSKGLPLAMMLGYVMNSHSDRARRGLQRIMKSKSVAIGLKSEKDTQTDAARPLRFLTVHSCNSGAVIEVTHTLLGWP